MWIRTPWKFIFRCAVACVLMVFLVQSTGIRTLTTTLATVHPGFAILVGICLFVTFLLGAFNIWLLLRVNHAVAFFPYLKTYAYSWVASLITPGQTGDASLVLFLKREGVPMKRTALVYLIDKAITLVCFSWIALWGSWVLFPKYQVVIGPIAALLSISAISIAAMTLFFSRWIGWLKKNSPKLSAMATDFEELRSQWWVLLINLSATVIKWGIVSLGFFFAFCAFQNQVGLLEITVIPIISTLVGYVPVSVSGIGTVEITAVHLFSTVGIAQTAVLSAYLLLRLLQYLLAVGLLAGLSLLDGKD